MQWHRQVRSKRRKTAVVGGVRWRVLWTGAFFHQLPVAIGIYLRACIYTHACVYMRSEDAAFFSSYLAASASSADGHAASASTAGGVCAAPGTAAYACCSRVYALARLPMARGAEVYTHIGHTFLFVAHTGKHAPIE